MTEQLQRELETFFSDAVAALMDEQPVSALEFIAKHFAAKAKNAKESCYVNLESKWAADMTAQAPNELRLQQVTAALGVIAPVTISLQLAAQQLVELDQVVSAGKNLLRNRASQLEYRLTEKREQCRLMQQTLDSLHANVFRTKLDSAAAVAPRLLYQRAIDGMDQEESGVLPGLNTLAKNLVNHDRQAVSARTWQLDGGGA